MKIILPQRSHGAADIIDTNETHTIVIVGANGAGKTRFTNRMCADLGESAYRLSVIDALYKSGAPDPEHSTIDRLHAASAISAQEKARPQSRLERLLALMMTDELANLLAYKVQVNRGEKVRLQPTRLDKLIHLFSEIIPDNKLTVESGKILFSRNDSDDTYNVLRLSDGERAVLYYGAAMLYAPENAVVVVDSPDMFLHPTTLQAMWNRLEQMRPDCTMVYATHDLEFASSRRGAALLWVQSCDMSTGTWEYSIMPDTEDALTGEVYMAIIGARKPILFIEGDDHSIDARLYPLIFRDYSVKSLGSCNKVIESTRTFNDLTAFHHLNAMGIVDRDRREEGEVTYLRRKNIMVPEVAEIENMLMLEDVVRAVASYMHKNADRVVASVKKSVLAQFKNELRSQALQHTRHRVKRTVEYRIDGKFPDIGALEDHINNLVVEIQPRKLYEKLCRDFREYLAAGDYGSVLRVFNQKTMLSASNVAQLCGLHDKVNYINTIMHILRTETPQSEAIRRAVRRSLMVE
jgi:ABC-type cobalamin/Fe3+-siderophores transport system ATPase subunit